MIHPTVTRMSVCLALLFAVLAPARPAYAAGVVGDGTPGSCTDAAFTAALLGGGTVTFNCGGPATILITSEKIVTVNTIIDGGGVITLAGGLATRLIATEFGSGTALDLRNITLDSAYSNNASGAAVRAFGPLTMTNVTIQNSIVAPNFCGGAVLIGGDALIDHSTFQNNAAPLGGGALCVRSALTNTVTIRDSLFYNNQGTDGATGYGGALYADLNSRVTVIDSVFLGNVAHLGGAAYVGPNAAISLQGTPSDSIFSSKMQVNGNRSSEDGGALYNAGGALAIDGSLITANSTPTQTALFGYGGAVFSSGVLTLTRSLLSQNQGRFGGALFIGNGANPQAVVDRVTFKLNVSGSLGGGLYANTATSSVAVSNSLFYLNTAGGGGGLARFNAPMVITNTAFIQNTALSGGGLSLSAGPSPTSGPYVRVENATISGNTATSGPSGGVFNNGRAELYSVTIEGNTGGVYTSGGGNTRFRNAVLHNAGTLNCDGDGSGQISNDSHNHVTDTSCGAQFPTAGADPLLASLAIDPGSGAYYHAPLPGSPLINTGEGCPTRDQLGALRLEACDIGAVEFGGLLPKVYLTSLSR